MSLFSDGIAFWIRICLYFGTFITPSTFTRSHTPLANIQPHTITEPPPMLNRRLQESINIFSPTLQTYWCLLEPKCWNWDSSLQTAAPSASYCYALYYCFLAVIHPPGPLLFKLFLTIEEILIAFIKEMTFHYITDAGIFHSTFVFDNTSIFEILDNSLNTTLWLPCWHKETIFRLPNCVSLAMVHHLGM